jgi:hypothetical protein
VAATARHRGTPRNSRSASTSIPGPAERATRAASVTSPTWQPSSSASTTAWVPHSTSATMRTCAERPATLAPVGAGTPELGVVGWRVGHLPARTVHRHQPQAPPARPGRGRRGQRPGRGGEQHRQRLGAQPLPGANQRRRRRHPPPPPPTQVAQPFGQVPQHLQVGRRREQRQGQHDVPHQPRWQQPPTLPGRTRPPPDPPSPGGYTQVNTPSPDSSGTPSATGTTPDSAPAAYAPTNATALGLGH